MEAREARALAAQLNIAPPKTWGDFFKALDVRDLDIGVDNKTGDWVVLDNKKVVARLA